MPDFLIKVAHAAGSCPPGTPAGTTCLTNPIGTTSVPEVVGRVINAGLGVIGSITLLVFIYGGLLWLTSGGEAEKVEKGKESMKWAAIGVIIVFSSYALVKFVIGGLSGL